MSNRFPEHNLEPVRTLYGAGERLLRWFAEGPDPLDPRETPSLLRRMLPWPVRLGAVALVGLAAELLRNSGAGQQVAWGLQVGSLALVSIISAFWKALAMLDSGVALLWFLPFKKREESPLIWQVLHVVTFLNRQVGHIKAIVVWMLVAFAASASLPWQLGLFAASLLLGPPLLNGLARLPLEFLSDADSNAASGNLLWRRRIFIYLATLCGVLLLGFSAPRQLRQFAPVVFAFGAGLLLRIAKHFWRRHSVRVEFRAGNSSKLDERAAFRQTQAKVAQRADAPIAALLVLTALGGIGYSWWQRQELDKESASQAMDGPDMPEDRCGRDPGGPAIADIALFVMGDAQTHELSGQPYSGQSELSEAFVKSASRPVALDMLSAVPIRHFLDAYRELAATRAAQSRDNQAQGLPPLAPMRWAHLGDLADLCCQRELTRMLDSLQPFFDAGPIASIAVGNHETSFIGSFHWSPYWDSVCASGRLEPDETGRVLEAKLAAPVRAQGGELVRITAPYFNPSGAALTSVVPLGVSSHAREPRGVIGVFLDTSDGEAFDDGSPGSLGSISQDQLDRTGAAIRRVREAAGGAFQTDPAYVLFGHVPLGELASSSSSRLEAFVRDLDEEAMAHRGPRVLAMISAHTHVAGAHRHCVGGRLLREIVIGSTTDAPEQAGLIEIGPDTTGNLALQLRTLQTVARPNLTCSDGGDGVAADQCRQIASELAGEPACRDLLLPADNAPARDCKELEHSFTLTERISAALHYDGPRGQTERAALKEVEAARVLRCVCRGEPRCEVSATPLRDESYVQNLEALMGTPNRRQELVCLAWAASATQAHKAALMSLSEALRCSFDDATIPSERVTVANLAGGACP